MLAHAESSEENTKFLSFELNERKYAIDIMCIREIMEYRDVEAVPLMPDYIDGAINLRGSVIAVIDLHRRLGISDGETTHRTCIVIVEVKLDQAIIEVGFKVDSVNQVFDVSDAQIEETPSLGGQIDAQFILGMGKVGEHFIVLLDTKKVLTIDEIGQLKNMNVEAPSV